VNLTLASESLAELVEHAATLAAEKVRDELRPEWLNESDAAAYIGISKKALGNARRAEKIAGHKHGHIFVYSRSELDRFARKGS